MKRLIALATVLLIGTWASAGVLNPLDMGLGVRAMGLGGAYTALARGTESLLFNPAGLAHQNGVRADTSYTAAMGEFGVGWLAGAMPSLGAGVAYLSVGDIVDPEGNPLAFRQFSLVAGGGLNLARLPIPAPFPGAVGGGLKLCSTRAADHSAVGIALDIAAQARLPLPFGDLDVGLAVRDLGLGLGIGEEGGGWSTEIALGAAVSLPMDVFAAVELSTHYTALGVGWQPVDVLEVRGGLQLATGIVRWALGLGVGWEEFTLDYALMTHPQLGTTHRLGFGVDVGALLGL